MRNLPVLMRFLKLLIVFALAVAIPFVACAAIYAIAPDTYLETYYAALPLKMDRLCQTDGPRVIVIGGSSVAFGIDSKLVSREVGMPVVNFGLYAAFGLKPMLDLSEKYINDGDIIVIAPETTEQMYSRYTGYDYLLQAFESRPGQLIGLGRSYYAGLAKNLPDYVKSARELRARGGAPTSGVYSLSAFDEFGDIVYEKPENIMKQGYSEDNLPKLSDEIVTDEFLEMVNDYVKAAERKGATVVFSYCPLNALSVENTDGSDVRNFVRALENGLDCRILAPIEDYILDEGFFYDSNYHLNDTGARYYSLRLAANIQRILGEMKKMSVSFPHAPEFVNENKILSSGNLSGILYDITLNGCVITGLDENGKMIRNLEIPETIDAVPVFSVSEGAFSLSNAQTIVLPETITYLSGSLFSDAPNLQRVELHASFLPEVSEELFENANSSVTLYVPEEMYGTYITDYFWGVNASRMKPMEDQ